MLRLPQARPHRSLPSRRATAAAALVLAAALAAAVPAAASSVPASAPHATAASTRAPGAAAEAPRPPAVLFQEGFEDDPGGPRLLTGYTGAPPLAETYTADPAWLTECNGWLVSAADPATAPAGSACGTSWPRLRTMASALGAWAGNDPAANHAVTAYTAGDPGAGKVQLETVKPVPLQAANRFLTFSVDVAAANCFAAHPLLQFSLLDGDRAVPAFTDPIDACADPGRTTDDGTAVGTYAGNDAVLFSGPSAGVRLVNAQPSGTGNDAAIDNLRLLDATPQLSKSFDPGLVAVGDDTTLTFTVTNTAEEAAKRGWSFTEQLPPGLVVTDPSSATTTCGSGTVAISPGGHGITSGGDLAAGQESCTIQVSATSARSGTYTLCAADTTVLRGVDPPGCTSVTFVALLMDAHAQVVKAAPGAPLAPSDVTCTEDPATDDAGLSDTHAGSSTGSFTSASTHAAGIAGTGSGRTATATATVSGLHFLGGLVSADQATATATASAPGALGTVTVTGSTTLAGAHIGNTRTAADPAPNTVITFPQLGTVTLNEQVVYGDGRGIVVNAIHVRLADGTDIVIGGTRASLTRTPGPCP
ncbi:choice-of-anchor P family protein, partial [Streptomyces sp. IBSBF 2435]|uniref:choice-of-anchor P family protein n=1 Tax=Streptomyces sp. IBSBF 2435 TaxID=2903531 RepID=UPI002FDBD671